MKDLSISILSSGRLGKIERCLRSLQSIKAALDVEIVVVDTSSSKNTVVEDALQEYADKVIRFDWVDDFASARNAGLAVCTGRWFLYIDDDEWIEDANPLIDFFSSNQEADKHWANILVRNYKEKNMTVYSDVWTTRMFRIDGKTWFKGFVHEEPYPLSGDPLGIKMRLGHDGYIFASEKDRIAHCKRNIALLEKVIEQEPQNLRWRMHILQEYDILGNIDAQIDLCDAVLNALDESYRKGLGHIVPPYTSEAPIMHGVFMAARLRIEERRADWNEELAIYKSRFCRTNHMDIANAYIDAQMALCYFSLGLEEESRVCCKEYLAAYERINGSEAEFSDQFMYFLSDTFKDEMFERVQKIGKALDIPLSSGKNSVVDEWIESLKEVGAYADSSNPVLSVVVLSVGKDDVLECVSSLIEVRKAIPTELIVISSDRLENDEHEKIVEKQTDRYIKLEWGENRSKALNAGLEIAGGEWFLYLSEDE